MSLVAGTRLGPYGIQSVIGAGGMGEVYQARDTRLDRTVAIKVLPAELVPIPSDARASAERPAPWRRSRIRTSAPCTTSAATMARLTS